jgi:uncharacterized protein
MQQGIVPDHPMSFLAERHGLTRPVPDPKLPAQIPHNFEVFLKLHLANLGDTKLFTAHGADHVIVNGERFDHSIVVLAEEVRNDWVVTGFEGLNETHFTYFLNLKPDVLLLGTGARQHFPHPRLYRALTEAGIGLECMDTPAACRTYNILVAEGRRAIAAILV